MENESSLPRSQKPTTEPDETSAHVPKIRFNIIYHSTSKSSEWLWVMY
jgi:hypothetical protein